MVNTKNKKIDVIVEARLSSTRLPGKILLSAGGKPLLEHMIERLNRIKNVSNVIIATTTNESDNEIIKLADKVGVPYYRGSENDVLGRVVETAQKFDTDIIVEITSDNPLIDPSLSTKVIDKLLELYDTVDYVSNDQMVTLGFNTRAFKTTLLEKVAKITQDPVDREHVVNYIVKHATEFRIYNLLADKDEYRKDLRLTMDHIEDYQVIKALFDSLYENNKEFTYKDIYSFLDNNDSVRSINKSIVQRTYKY